MKKFNKYKMEKLIWKAVQVAVDLMSLDRYIQNEIEKIKTKQRN